MTEELAGPKESLAGEQATASVCITGTFTTDSLRKRHRWSHTFYLKYFLNLMFLLNVAFIFRLPGWH